MGAMELQIFVSLLVVLGAAFVALICDFLKGNNEKLREVNIELTVRQEERERADSSRDWLRGVKPAVEPAMAGLVARAVEKDKQMDAAELPAGMTEGIPAYPRRRRPGRTAEPEQPLAPSAIPPPVQPAAVATVTAAMEDWARRVVERGAAGRVPESLVEGPAPAEMLPMAAESVVETGATEPLGTAELDQASVSAAIERQSAEIAPAAPSELQDLAGANPVRAAATEVAAAPEAILGQAGVMGESQDQMPAQPAAGAVPELTAALGISEPAEMAPAARYELQGLADPSPMRSVAAEVAAVPEAIFGQAGVMGESQDQMPAQPAAGAVPELTAALGISEPAEMAPPARYELQGLAGPSPMRSVAMVPEAILGQARVTGEFQVQMPVQPTAGAVPELTAALHMGELAEMAAAPAKLRQDVREIDIECVNPVFEAQATLELDVAASTDLPLAKRAGLVAIEMQAPALGEGQAPAATHVAPIQTVAAGPSITMISGLSTAQPDWTEAEAAEPSVEIAEFVEAPAVASAEPSAVVEEVAPENRGVAEKCEEPGIDEIVRVKVLDVGDLIDLCGVIAVAAGPVPASAAGPKISNIEPIRPEAILPGLDLKGLDSRAVCLDGPEAGPVIVEPSVEAESGATTGEPGSSSIGRMEDAEPLLADAVAAEMVPCADELQWPFGTEESDLEFVAPPVNEHSETQEAGVPAEVSSEIEAEPEFVAPPVSEEIEPVEQFASAEVSNEIEAEPEFVAPPVSEEIEPVEQFASAEVSNEIEAEPEFVAPPVSEEIDPVHAHDERFLDVDNELELNAKVLQMPAPVAYSDYIQPAAVQIPRGIHDRQALAGLIEQQLEFRGVVFFLGLLGYEHLIAEHGQASVRQSVESANEYLDTLLGEKGFGCWAEESIFVMLLPAAEMELAREISQQTAEALWDYQLRSLGNLPLIFHWGCAEAGGGQLASAIEMARDQMLESGRARKQVLSASGRFRRRVVNG